MERPARVSAKIVGEGSLGEAVLEGRGKLEAEVIVEGDESLV